MKIEYCNTAEALNIFFRRNAVTWNLKRILWLVIYIYTLVYFETFVYVATVCVFTK
jgi:uncharacterized MAPEG superfamily protein